jgi:DNA-binding NarL/FixJ family response regulator
VKTPNVRLLLVDDHALVRTGLRMLVESRPEFTVVAEAGGGAAALEAASRERPDIILLDIDLRAESGIDLIQDLIAAAPGARVLMLTGVKDQSLHRRAFTLGAVGLVEKDKAAEVLLKAIECVHAGEVWIDRSMMAEVIVEFSRPQKPIARDEDTMKIGSLSARERDVIALLAEGLNNKNIAARLFVSETTVRHHLSSIFTKLGVRDRLELVVYAYRHKIAAPPAGA